MRRTGGRFRASTAALLIVWSWAGCVVASTFIYGPEGIVPVAMLSVPLSFGLLTLGFLVAGGGMKAFGPLGALRISPWLGGVLGVGFGVLTLQSGRDSSLAGALVSAGVVCLALAAILYIARRKVGNAT